MVNPSLKLRMMKQWCSGAVVQDGHPSLKLRMMKQECSGAVVQG